MTGEDTSKAIDYLGESSSEVTTTEEIFEGTETIVEVAEVGEGLELTDLLVLLLFL